VAPPDLTKGALVVNLEKVVFGFFILLAATLNFGFVYGDIDNPHFHNQWEFFAALVVNLIATVLKFGDRTHVGAIHLAASLVALIQLVAAALVWFFAPVEADGLVSGTAMAGIVSLAAGALLANLISVIILIAETILQRR
jgi:Ca2+/H+ antiporter, TMEM165/GDT1 family